MSVRSSGMPKYQVQAFDARGLIIGDDNTIYQYIVADPRFRILADRLYTFTALIEEKTRAYVGRRFVFDAFDKFMKQNDRGYFIVQGEPGIGKTALVAQLVRTRGYVHHFLIATQGIVKVEQFVQNVTLQLMARYRMEPLPGHLLGIVDSGLLSSVLDRVSGELEPDDRVVVAVDALDEAEPIKDPRANVLCLPASLPSGVFFLVTSRYLADLPLRIDVPYHYLNVNADSEDNLLDITTFLKQEAHKEGLSARLRDERLTETDFVQIMLEKSEGNFMYLHYVLPKIESGDYPGLLIKELPKGLRNYYEHHWRKVRSTDEESWVKYRQPVICVLAAVREPVTVETVATLAKLEMSRVRAALRDWQEFLDCEPIGRDKRYRIYHTSFQDFLREKDEVGEVDMTQVHSDIADALWEQWSSGMV